MVATWATACSRPRPSKPCAQTHSVATMITPNLPRAAALLDEPVASNGDAANVNNCWTIGCRAVLIKGGHGQGASLDYLFAPWHARAGRRRFDTRIPTAPAVRCHRPLLRVSRKARFWRPPCATPKPGSAPRSRPPTASASAMATGQSIIFIAISSGSSSRRPCGTARGSVTPGTSVDGRHIDGQLLVGHFAPAFSRIATISR